MEKLKLSRDEIAAISGESLNIIDDAVSAGHLTTFIVGRRRFARPEAVRAWIDFLQAQSDAGKPVSYRARKREQVAA